MTFKKSIIILVAGLTVIASTFILFVADSFRMYNDNRLDNYMASFIENLKDADYDIAIANASEIKKSEFDRADASIRKGLAYLAQKDSLTFQAIYSSDQETKSGSSALGTGAYESPVFDIYDGNNPLLRVTLNAKEHVSRLGLLSFNEWEVKEVRLLKKGGLFDYEISLPNNCSVEVNGRKLTEKESPDSLQFVGYADISKTTALTYHVNYRLKGLIDAPDVKVTDRNGNAVECESTGTRIFKPLECVKAADEASAKAHIKNYPDIMHIMKEWSLYMSHDQHGGKNGFEDIEQYLAKGTYIYLYSERWSESVDITYVSNHGLDKQTFSNEKVCNFEIYNEKEFSCDVYFQKNLLVNGKLADKLAERVHFLYYDDTDDGKDNPAWKIVSLWSLPKMENGEL